MLTFKNYLLKESCNYDYKVPFSIKQQFFDFYIWMFAYQSLSYSYKENESTDFADLKKIIPDAALKIANSQKDILLEAAYKGIYDEAKYAFDESYKHCDRELLADIVKNGKITNSQYNNVLLFKRVFSVKDAWDYSYGGPAWAKICDGWIQLFDAKSLEEKLFAIDYMYSLRHNTGVGINKDSRFDNEWVSFALNMKFKGNFNELQKYSSIRKDVVNKILYHIIEKTHPEIDETRVFLEYYYIKWAKIYNRIKVSVPVVFNLQSLYMPVFNRTYRDHKIIGSFIDYCLEKGFSLENMPFEVDFDKNTEFLNLFNKKYVKEEGFLQEIKSIKFEIMENMVVSFRNFKKE